MPLRRIQVDLSNGYHAERRQSLSSESSQEQQQSPESNQDSPDKQSIGNGNRISSPETDPAEQFMNLDYDEQMVLGCLGPEPSPDASASISFGTFSIIGPDPQSYSRQLRNSQSNETIQAKPGRQLSPAASRIQSTLFFLDYYRKVVREYHYFLYHDHQKLSTETLLAMAEQSSALKNSMVAFAALVYSMRIPGAARHIAFVYYAIALKELRQQLDEYPMSIEQCQRAVATALQLSSIDVYPCLT